LAGHPDKDVYQEALSIERIVITRDLDFSDVRFYLGPSGIALVRDRHNLTKAALLETTMKLVEDHLDDLTNLGRQTHYFRSRSTWPHSAKDLGHALSFPLTLLSGIVTSTFAESSP
jgi:hypothetical protein